MKLDESLPLPSPEHAAELAVGSDLDQRRHLTLLQEGQPDPNTCPGGLHPCPWTRCRYHLGENESGYMCCHDFTRDFPEGATEHVIGLVLGCTRQNVRYHENAALWKLLKRAKALRDFR